VTRSNVKIASVSPRFEGSFQAKFLRVTDPRSGTCTISGQTEDHRYMICENALVIKELPWGMSHEFD
jgi:hypothetical protein